MCHCARDVVKMMIECWAKVLIFTIILATMAELAGASMPPLPSRLLTSADVSDETMS